MKNPRDFWTGVIYVAVGVGGRGHRPGLRARHGVSDGPGLLSRPSSEGLLVLIGLLSLGRAALRPGEPLPPARIKGLLAVTAATLGFGALVRGAGLVVALPVLVVGERGGERAIPLGAGARAGRGAHAVLRGRLRLCPWRSHAASRYVVRRLTQGHVELLTNLGLGLQTAFTLTNLLYCLVGVFLGTLIGVLPGLGPTATIAMLLPITFGCRRCRR